MSGAVERFGHPPVLQPDLAAAEAEFGALARHHVPELGLERRSFGAHLLDGALRGLPLLLGCRINRHKRVRQPVEIDPAVRAPRVRELSGEAIVHSVLSKPPEFRGSYRPKSQGWRRKDWVSLPA